MRKLAMILALVCLSSCDTLQEWNEREIPVEMGVEIAERFADVLTVAAGEDGVLKGYQEWTVLALGLYDIVRELSDDETDTDS